MYIRQLTVITQLFCHVNYKKCLHMTSIHSTLHNTDYFGGKKKSSCLAFDLDLSEPGAEWTVLTANRIRLMDVTILKAVITCSIFLDDTDANT